MKNQHLTLYSQERVEEVVREKDRQAGIEIMQRARKRGIKMRDNVRSRSKGTYFVRSDMK